MTSAFKMSEPCGGCGNVNAPKYEDGLCFFCVEEAKELDGDGYDWDYEHDELIIYSKAADGLAGVLSR
jgi:hypothetical protein